PLPKIIQLQETYGFRIHADAAYGGYFTLASLLRNDARASFDALVNADSIVIDPHKHGLQPYGCGCVLFNDASVGQFYKHGSPYTYFSSADLHLGEISLECSRPGAAAVALWATQQLLPPSPRGAFAAMLDNCIAAARQFFDRLEQSEHFLPLMVPELDIVVYAVNAADGTTASENARQVFGRAAEHDLHLALIELPTKLVRQHAPQLRETSETITCLRSVLMKPEQLDWLDQIMTILETSVTEIV
ncbi:MAG: pyridoxal-dependent decarboxylase, partial [Woeseiaceae bacterium]